jgi:hypothetical protein
MNTPGKQGNAAMSEALACFRCGASLQNLSLPLGRRDECPECSVDLHVCRMCEFFDEAVPKQCREDDAEEVFEKEKANFCEWFKPSPDAFDPVRAGQAAQAKSDLAALFGEEPETKPAADKLLEDAEDLFK